MKVVLAAAAVLLVVLVVGLKLIPPNLEPLTELYFDDHTSLPKDATPVLTPLAFEPLALRFPDGKEYRIGDLTRAGLENATIESGNRDYIYEYARFVQANASKTVLAGAYVREYPVQRFSFAIHNLEYKTVTYEYLVTFERNETIRELLRGNVTLADNQTVHIPAEFYIREEFDRARVRVQLVGRNESIHFWVER